MYTVKRTFNMTECHLNVAPPTISRSLCQFKLLLFQSTMSLVCNLDRNDENASNNAKCHHHKYTWQYMHDKTVYITYN